VPPTGTSKWNKIEHRLFCHITMNWRGRPLTSYEVILESIAATTTTAGLHVKAALDTADYPTGITTSDAQMAALAITRHRFHGDWNYTLHPQLDAVPASDTPPDTFTRLTPDVLADPTLTGMSTDELTTLTTALDALRLTHRQAANRASGHSHAPRSGRPPQFSFPNRVLATILHLRISVSQEILARVFTTSRTTIRRAITETRQLLNDHGTHITATPTPPGPLNDLLTAANTETHHL
jgi:hypothetical protein